MSRLSCAVASLIIVPLAFAVVLVVLTVIVVLKLVALKLNCNRSLCATYTREYCRMRLECPKTTARVVDNILYRKAVLGSAQFSNQVR